MIFLISYSGLNEQRMYPIAAMTLLLLVGLGGVMYGVWHISKPNGLLRQRTSDTQWYIGAGGIVCFMFLTLFVSSILEQHEKQVYLYNLQKNDPAAYQAHIAKIQAEQQAQVAREQKQTRSEQPVTTQQPPKSIDELNQEKAIRCMEGLENGDVDGYAFYDLAKKLVVKQLRAPSTAEFPDIRQASAMRMFDKNFKCLTTVSGYVDAQNGFGAQIRQRWEVVFQSKADNTGLDLKSIKIGD
ncbi:MAG: hypothetical protein WAZ18_05495 [Alphaproteobacteria bacterium]